MNNDLIVCCQNGLKDAVKALVKNGADINYKHDPDNGSTPIMYAAQNGHLDLIKFFVENGVDILYKKPGDGSDVFYYAVQSFGSRLKILEYLFMEKFKREKKLNEGVTESDPNPMVRQVLQKSKVFKELLEKFDDFSHIL